MGTSLLRAGLAGALALALAACAARVPDADPSVARVPEGLDRWVLKGRLAVSNGRDGGSGELTWEQQGESARLAFVGAFGRGSWRLGVEPGQVVLELADGAVYRAESVEALARRHFGWDLPVASLRHWVLGRAGPGADDLRRDDLGRLELVSEDGWLVQLEGYHQLEQGQLPRKITATRDEERVRLLIREWRL